MTRFAEASVKYYTVILYTGKENLTRSMIGNIHSENFRKNNGN
jgi:hypothetical protein